MPTSNQEFRERFLSLTKNIPDSSVDELISIAKECVFSAGDTVIQDNSPSNKLFFILDGNLVSFIERNGNKIELGEMKPGGIAGEVSMFGDCPSTATLMAKTDCRLLALGKEDLNQLQESTPELISQLLRTISNTLASKMLASDKLLYQRISGKEENDTGYNDIPSFIAWCTTMYQRIHGHKEV
jgi:CRP/FNR family transcriptional regulator